MGFTPRPFKSTNIFIQLLVEQCSTASNRVKPRRKTQNKLKKTQKITRQRPNKVVYLCQMPRLCRQITARKKPCCY